MRGVDSNSWQHALGPESPLGAPGCCPTGAPAAALAGASPDDETPPDPLAYVRSEGAGAFALDLMVPAAHCADCIRKVEGALRAEPAVGEARLNLSTRRLKVRWRGEAALAHRLVGALAAQGYAARPFDPALLAAAGTEEDRRLLRALAVAGFAAGNVMLLSISVWAGAASDMGAATRDFFHWLSALIALPAVAFAGQPFFRSALAALRARRLNMDVPISLGVLLAVGMSAQQTIAGGPHAYFDAAVALLFFLLIGRYFDRRARAKARSAAERLMVLKAAAATVVEADGGTRALPLGSVAPGMRVRVAAGERVPVDGRVRGGRSDVDESLVTGESVPRAAGPGDPVFAGTLNLTGPLEIEVTAAAEGTLLAEIVRLMEAAEQGRARYVRLADRAARLYAPLVHVVAAGTFLGWFVLGGSGLEAALMNAVAVLIITCPCALALAVPAVQVAATGRLLRRGILVKSADGLERLAAVDAVAFDKTGTLTLGRAVLRNPSEVAERELRLAARLAAASRHPLARALVRAAPRVAPAEGVAEHPGEGLSATVDGVPVRLGSRAFCGLAEGHGAEAEPGPELWLARAGWPPVRFAFADRLRADAGAVVAALAARGLAVELLSGDRGPAVEWAAREAGIARFAARLGPAEKAARLAALAGEGRKVLMVGDGLNDAPALRSAFVSISPASAADVSQTAADLVFQGDSLAPVLDAIEVARASARLVRQNFALAVLYNAVAVPVAVLGLVTPLIAAAAMSASSLAVTLNALRLALPARPGTETTTPWSASSISSPLPSS